MNIKIVGIFALFLLFTPALDAGHTKRKKLYHRAERLPDLTLEQMHLKKRAYFACLRPYHGKWWQPEAYEIVARELDYRKKAGRELSSVEEETLLLITLERARRLAYKVAYPTK